MKVLIINGSPRVGGNTTIAVNEMVKVFEAEGAEAEVVQIGNQAIRGCISCNTCAKTGKCVFDDAVNELAAKFEAADGLVVASPVYYASANATLIACLDRLFYSTHFDKTMKVGASVVVARRGGCSFCKCCRPRGSCRPHLHQNDAWYPELKSMPRSPK